MATTPRFAIPERTRVLLSRFLVFPLYFVCCLTSSAYETFPYDRVRDFAIHQIERALPGAEVEIVSLEPAWISGVEATGIRIRLPQGEGQERRTELTVPRVYARAGIFAYLFGTTDITFEVETDGGGSIVGEVTDSTTGSGSDAQELTRVVAHLTSVDLRRIGVIRAALGIPVEGMVSGDIDVTLADELDATTGNITLTIAGVALGDGHAEISLEAFVPGMTHGLVVDRLRAGDMNLRVDVEHGVGRVQQLNSDGQDVQLQGQGTVRLLRPFRMSALDVLLRISFSQAYRDGDHARGLFMLAEANPLVAPYRTADGSFQLRLQGALGGRVMSLPAGAATLDH